VTLRLPVMVVDMPGVRRRGAGSRRAMSVFTGRGKLRCAADEVVDVT